jgi:hypothetical protein
MAKKKRINLITEDQEKQLQDMVNNMLEIASNVVEEYNNLDLSELSELSSSITQIHEDSPFLDEIFKGDEWKKVIKNIPPLPKTPKEDKEDDSK